MDGGTSSLPRKRQKYVSKACAACKRRKIKCNGELPCHHCDSTGGHCEYLEGKARGGARRAGHSVSQSLEPHGPLSDVYQRLRAVENKMESYLSHSALSEDTPPRHRSRDESILSVSTRQSPPAILFSPRGHIRSQALEQGTSVEQDKSSSEAMRISTLGFPGSVFYGQSSARNTLSNLRSELSQMSPAVARHIDDRPVTLAEGPGRQTSLSNDSMTFVHLPSWDETSHILDAMFEDLMSMYPIFHAPTFYDTYKRLWDDQGNYLVHIAHGKLFSPSQMGLLYACLAASASITHSTRLKSDDLELTRSTQWYTAAKALILHPSIDDLTDLESIQAMMMMSLYLMHIDNEDASYKVLGVGVRGAYEIGLHLASKERGLAADVVELRRRAWWCLYLLDCRTSIAIGRPCGIDIRECDVAYPSVLDDMSPFPQQLSAPMSQHRSKIPYLIRFVDFSRICGEVYERVFGVKCVWPPAEATVLELDRKLEQWRFELPAFLRFEPKKLHLVEPWLSKQQLFLHLRGAHLRLVLLRPFVSDETAVARSSYKMAESALRLSSEVIHTISMVKRTSDLVEKLWYPSKQIILSCIGIIFCGVLHFPSRFSASSSKVDLRVALQLLKDFSEKSKSKKTLRDVEFLRYLCNQALRSRNQALLDSAAQSRAQSPLPDPMTTTNTSTSPMTAALATKREDSAAGNSTDLSFLHMSEMTEHGLLMDLLDSGDPGWLPTMDQFLSMGEDSSRQSMLSF